MIYLAFILTIVAVASIWHIDVNHNIDRLGQEKTRGIFKLKPEKAIRYAQYTLIFTIIIYDFIIAYLSLK